MSSSKTIRLQNLLPNANLSLYLHQPVAASRGSLRRGPTFTPILIRAGQYFDVCAQLRVSFEEAQMICARSPEVQQLKRTARLLEMVYPPEATTVVPPPAAPAPEPAPVAAPVHAEVAPASASAKAKLPAPTPPAAPPPVAPPPVETAPAAPVEVLEAPTPVPEPETPEAGRRLGEPSMDWAEDELRFYAASKGIDLSRARSKTAILRTIRSAK